MRSVPTNRPQGAAALNKADYHMWPKGTIVVVNGVCAEIEQRKQQSHDNTLWKGKSDPLDLAPFIKWDNNDECVLNIAVFCHDRNSYSIDVGCYELLTPERVVEKAKKIVEKRGASSIEADFTEVQKLFDDNNIVDMESDDDEGIEVLETEPPKKKMKMSPLPPPHIEKEPTSTAGDSSAAMSAAFTPLDMPPAQVAAGSMGRGRGRAGLSNLPAWMTEQNGRNSPAELGGGDKASSPTTSSANSGGDNEASRKKKEELRKKLEAKKAEIASAVSPTDSTIANGENGSEKDATRKKKEELMRKLEAKKAEVAAKKAKIAELKKEKEMNEAKIAATRKKEEEEKVAAKKKAQEEEEKEKDAAKKKAEEVEKKEAAKKKEEEEAAKKKAEEEKKEAAKKKAEEEEKEAAKKKAEEETKEAAKKKAEEEEAKRIIEEQMEQEEQEAAKKIVEEEKVEREREGKEIKDLEEGEVAEDELDEVSKRAQHKQTV